MEAIRMSTHLMYSSVLPIKKYITDEAKSITWMPVRRQSKQSHHIYQVRNCKYLYLPFPQHLGGLFKHDLLLLCLNSSQVFRAAVHRWLVLRNLASLSHPCLLIGSHHPLQSYEWWCLVSIGKVVGVVGKSHLTSHVFALRLVEVANSISVVC